MSENAYETRIDNENREKIWKKEAEAWLEKFKSEETPVEKRITDYRLNGWGMDINNESKIQGSFYFEVTPVDENNTSWDNPKRNSGYIEMSNVDGEYKVDYLAEVPKGYDKFLEEFEKWKEENKTVETQTVQGEKIEINANTEINKMSNGIIILCVTILATVVTSMIIKIVKKKKFC